MVLTLGNALNGSTFRGGARGFKLDALLKVCDYFEIGALLLMVALAEGDKNR